MPYLEISIRENTRHFELPLSMAFCANKNKYSNNIRGYGKNTMDSFCPGSKHVLSFQVTNVIG
ncbi:MAG: hypothetical protein BMS9Abin33_0376 [Gammaproteobacteria bacterium]|nr:MAG: hypothetical protein BMS9Abin33_0376 [Gammaproteobacteria bacterium]